MTKKELKPIQVELLRLMNDIDKLFKDNGLGYFAVYGTLIGTIREKGFIPWDDDIDLGMTRPMYDKLLSIAKKNGGKIGKFDVACGEIGNSLLPFCKIFDKRYKLNAKGVEGDEDYLFIDIFPYDPIPDDEDEYREFLAENAKLRKTVAISRLTYKGLFDVTKNKILYPIKAIIKLSLKFRGEQKVLDRYLEFCKKYKSKKTKYIGSIVWGDGFDDRIRVDGLKTVRLPFEDSKIDTFKDYDNHLRGLYGDYMKRPEVKDRVCHDIEIIKVSD